MYPSNRVARSIIAVAVTLWSQACVTRRPLPVDVTAPRGARVNARSALPFPLSDPDSSSGAAPLCRATAVEGRVRQVMGDTLVLERVSGVVNAPDSDGVLRGCPPREIVAFVRTPDTQMTVRETDKKRTTFLLLGIAAALVGFAAFAASQIEYSLPTGTGTYGFGRLGVHP